MLKQISLSSIFWRNCIIAYIIVGFSSSLIAEFYQSFQISNQWENGERLSRLVSIGVAYSMKENLYK
ncbi:hypothetical protein VKI21_02825 [Cyanobacterium aponinum UTEX 3222]|uniref:Uncharacterized protein n=1 Tax=Cyanobacterium aponinum AL20115 TaxID=3090662 RepID=A0AAF1C2B7_9CHRO|nr:hypothetical protein [Cyanobacterium aponinum]WPF88508.1 hypothetical protein SAY89_17210 [Cyanobacterium aponinum AL20115]WRL39795.1 hypothetical protein VKI22_06850 [Cyanobacterium aponinum UTEX 3221]WRL42640.1 hypothetical protein VKI21_02825 [Cyanobacterium aponinum UTEX 3222]